MATQRYNPEDQHKFSLQENLHQTACNLHTYCR